MSFQDPFARFKALFTGAGTTRRNVKSGRIDRTPVDFNTQFKIQEETRVDGNNTFETAQESQHYILACGCRASSPSQVRGICPECANKFGRKRKPRFVCPRHRLCLACRRKRLKALKESSWLYSLYAILIWPLCDVVDEEEEQDEP